MAKVRPARHYQRKDAPIRALADRSIPRIARSLKRALAVLDRTFDHDQALHFIRDGRWAEVAQLADVKHQQEALKLPLSMLGNVWLDGGEVGARRLNGQFNARSRVVRFRKAQASLEERLQAGPRLYGLRSRTAPILDLETLMSTVPVYKDQADLFNFDRFDEVTQLRIRAFQDELIRTLGVDSRLTIQQTIQDAMRHARTPEEIMHRIRAVIGLTPKQASAVMRFRQQLLDMNPAAAARTLLHRADAAIIRATFGAGQGLSAERIDQMVQAYQDRYLDYRALSIAQTETTRAASLGLQDSYAQAVDRGALPREAIRQYWQISLDETTCFPAGTPVTVLNGEMPIERLVAGQKVWTRSGYRPVVATSSKAYSQTVVMLVCRNGAAIACTYDHPILVGGGWREACDVKPGDLLHAPNDQPVQVAAVAHFEFTEPHCAPSLRGEPLVSAGILGWVMPVNAIDLYSHLLGRKCEVDQMAADSVLLVKFDASGERLADGFLYRCFALESAVAADRAKRSIKLARAPVHGRSATPARNHVDRAPTGFRAVLTAAIGLLKKRLAAPLALSMTRGGETAGARADFVAVGVGRRDAEVLAAPGAQLLDPAVRLVHDVLLHGHATVYDIEVQGAHEFYASGLLVHNCDHCLSVVDANPEGVPFGEQFDSDEGPVDAPPMHPNCRCSLEFVTDLDLVPD